MQHSSITLEVYFRKVWKLLLRRLHHSDDIRVKSYVRIILGHPICVELKQILHLKVGCSDFGPVRDRGSLPYLPSQLGKLRGHNPKMDLSRVGGAMPI